MVPSSLYPRTCRFFVVGAAVAEAVDEPGVAVVGEDDGLVLGEEGVEVGVRQAVGVLGTWLHLHQIDDVHDTDLQLRQALAQNRSGRQNLQRRHVSGTSSTTSGSAPRSLLAHSQMPMPAVQCFHGCGISSHCAGRDVCPPRRCLRSAGCAGSGPSPIADSSHRAGGRPAQFPPFCSPHGR